MLVKSMNMYQVPMDEVLSNNVYELNPETMKVEVAEELEQPSRSKMGSKEQWEGKCWSIIRPRVTEIVVDTQYLQAKNDGLGWVNWSE